MILRRFLLLLVLVFVFSANEGFAQKAELRWGVTPGFNGAYKENTWIPIHVDLANQGDSRSGELRIPRHGPRPKDTAISYAVPVELPQNSRKHYIIYAPSSNLETITLRLGRLQESKEIASDRIAASDDTLVVVIGGDGASLSFLTGTPAIPQDLAIFDYEREKAGNPTIQVSHTSWEMLPDSWLGWDGVDAVVLADANFAAASQQSLEALLQWVRLGGTLIVPGGAQAPQMATSYFADWLPIKVSGTAVLAGLNELQAWAGQPIELRPVLVAAGRLAPEAQLLCGAPEQPLIAVSKIGLGRVAMTAFDYCADPVKYWDGQVSMWYRLLAQTPANPPITDQAETTVPWQPDVTLETAASYTPTASFPPLWVLITFLGAYLLALVPLNHAVLKRLDRRELAWLTAPAIAIIFTLGAYGVGYTIRGNRLIFNRLGIIEAAPNARLARGRGYVSIFSPSRHKYDLLLEGLAASAREIGLLDERPRAAATVLYGPNAKVAGLPINKWSSRAVCVEFATDLKDGIGGYFEFDGLELRATVENKTGFTLREGRLLDSSGLDKTKRDIKPGMTEIIKRGSNLGFPDRNPNPSALAGKDVKQGMEDLALRALFGAGSLPQTSFQLASRKPAFLALVNEPLVPVKLDRKHYQLNDLNLIMVNLPLRLASGKRMAVPAGLISYRLVASKGLRNIDPWDPFVIIDQGEVVFEFIIPFGEKGGKTLSLSLDAPFDQNGQGVGNVPGRRFNRGMASNQTTPGATSQMVDFSAYNFTLGEWQSLKKKSAFPTPDAFTSKDGRVLIRMNTGSNSITLRGLQLTAEVETN